MDRLIAADVGPQPFDNRQEPARGRGRATGV